jgi:hypothetical protein
MRRDILIPAIIVLLGCLGGCGIMQCAKATTAQSESNGLGQCSADYPSPVYAISQGVWFESDSDSPIGNAHGLPMICDQMIPASVVRLCSRERPTTIAWGIGPVVVDPVETVQWRWFWTHILEELIEAVKPAFTDANSSLTMVLRLPAYPIRFASSDHIDPRSIFRRMGHLMLAREHVANAAATPISETHEIGMWSFRNAAAMDTPATPKAYASTGCIFSPFCFRQNEESTKNPTGKIKKWLVSDVWSAYCVLRHGYLLSRNLCPEPHVACNAACGSFYIHFLAREMQ